MALFSRPPQPPGATPFPYPTLFRSSSGGPASSSSTSATETENSIPSCSRIEFSVSVADVDRKSTRLNSSHANNSYAVFCLKKKKQAIEHIATLLAGPLSTNVGLQNP